MPKTTAVTTSAPDYDVAICGAGWLGLCSAFWCTQSGLRVCLIDPKPIQQLNQGLEVFWPSPNDPPTRVMVAHGERVSRYLCEFHSAGIQLLLDSILPKLLQYTKHTVPEAVYFKPTPIRLAQHDFEKHELQQACQTNLFLKNTLCENLFLETQQSLCFEEFFFNQLGSAWEKLLLASGVTFIKQQVQHIKENPSDCQVHLDNNKKIHSEMIILAAGYASGHLLPRFKDILVPMSDCLSTFIWNKPSDFYGRVLFRSSNGHWAGHLSGQKNKTVLKLSGPRFLLPRAGAGIALTDFTQTTTDREITNQKIQNFIHTQVLETLQKVWPHLQNNHLVNETFPKQCLSPAEQKTVQWGVDCLPCDELPILGPMGRSGRILGGGGWLGAGFSAAPLAGQILRDWVMGSPGYPVPDIFYPTRFDHFEPNR